MADLPPPNSEQRIQLAIEAFRSKAVPTIRKAAELFDVSVQLCKTASLAFNDLPLKRDSIVKAALRLHVWGWPLTLKSLDNLATGLLVKKGDLLPLVRDWHRKVPSVKGLYFSACGLSKERTL